MAELVLTYTDDNGEERRATIDAERFVIGRHSESDLCIPDGRLSRQHLQIDRFGDVFVASDAGSSNGTLLNDKPLDDPAGLKDGDVLDLGGVRILVGDPSNDLSNPQSEPDGNSAPGMPDDEVQDFPGSEINVVSQPAAAKDSNSWMLLVLIPVFGLILLVFAVGVIYLLSGQSNKTIAKKQDDFVYSTEDGDDDNDIKTPSDKSNAGNTTSQTGPTANDTLTGTLSNSNTAAPPGKLSDTAKIEQNGGAFLRRIAQNDPRAFLTSEQAQRVTTKVKQLSGSSALADNLNSARRNAAQIKSIAQAKNLKPQFLAIAAVAKLGNSRGDVVQTAQVMADVLDKLSVHLGNEFGEDSLLIIAAYSQGSAGDFMKMRNMLQQLANKFPESSRAIRTIWFLQKNGKITQSEFDTALNFLAVGTISQNPKEFGVNAEALSL